MYLNETYKNFGTGKFIFLVTVFSFLISFNAVKGIAADSIIVKAKHSDVEASSIYEIYFSIAQEIPQKAVIVVTFPENFDLAGVIIAGSTTINGGFEVTVDGSKVLLKRSGLGRIIKPYEKVDVKFANVKNPSEPADDYKIKVELKNESEITIIEKVETFKIVPSMKK